MVAASDPTNELGIMRMRSATLKAIEKYVIWRGSWFSA
jgi:hypothetical protein